MDVGIRDLKKHLSEYIVRASKGEHLRVTSRGRPVAQLGPIPGRLRLDEGLAEGWVSRESDAAPARVRGWKSSTTTESVLNEDRGV